jgi:hypothetical protein
MEGIGAHRCLELYYLGVDRGIAIGEGIKEMERVNPDVDYGETGSFEKSLESYKQKVNNYFAEELPIPKDSILAVESTAEVKVKGLPLPLNARTDLVLNLNGIEIYDWKFVRSFADDDGITPEREVQWFFNYHAVKETIGEPRAMVFVEIKGPKNKDGGPQIRLYRIDYDKDRMLKIKKLIKMIMKEAVKKRTVWLPPLHDTYSKSKSYDRFIESL